MGLMPMDCAMAAARAPRSDSSMPWMVRIFSGTMGRNMSTLTSATMDFSGMVGCAAKYLEPSRPFSSAVTSRNKIERFTDSGWAFKLAAISRTSALPEPLSMAPL